MLEFCVTESQLCLLYQEETTINIWIYASDEPYCKSNLTSGIELTFTWENLEQ